MLLQTRHPHHHRQLERPKLDTDHPGRPARQHPRPSICSGRRSARHRPWRQAGLGESEYDWPCYAYARRNGLTLLLRNDFIDFTTIMPAKRRATDNCALVIGRDTARVDPLLVAKVSLRKGLDLLRAGKWQSPAIAK